MKNILQKIILNWNLSLILREIKFYIKRMKPFIVIMLLACFPFIALADQSSQSDNSGKKITLQKGNNHGYIKTPKAPDRQVITCTYDGYGMDLDFTFSEGMGVLTVTDETFQPHVYDIDTSLLDVYVPVGNLAGTIDIELETENGNVYEGEIKQGEH